MASSAANISFLPPIFPPNVELKCRGENLLHSEIREMNSKKISERLHEQNKIHYTVVLSSMGKEHYHMASVVVEYMGVCQAMINKDYLYELRACRPIGMQGIPRLVSLDAVIFSGLLLRMVKPE